MRYCTQYAGRQTVWLLAGCASTPIPREQMAVAEAAVERASTSNTSANAAGRLQIAVSKLSAARLAEEVEVDAQLAELHAQSVRTGMSAQETQDAERALREEINRKATY